MDQHTAKRLDALLKPERMTRSFEDFECAVLLLATKPNPLAPTRVVPAQGSLTLQDHGTCLGLEVEYELSRWLQVVLQQGPEQVLELKNALMTSLMQASYTGCAYRLAPSRVGGARHVVLINEAVLQRNGRLAVLRRLWESEIGASMAAETSLSRSDAAAATVKGWLHRPAAAELPPGQLAANPRMPS